MVILKNHTNSCLSKLLTDGLVVHSSPVQIYKLSLMSFRSFLVLSMWMEKTEWKKLILWTCVLYTHDELRSGVFVID